MTLATCSFYLAAKRATLSTNYSQQIYVPALARLIFFLFKPPPAFVYTNSHHKQAPAIIIIHMRAPSKCQKHMAIMGNINVHGEKKNPM